MRIREALHKIIYALWEADKEYELVKWVRQLDPIQITQSESSSPRLKSQL